MNILSRLIVLLVMSIGFTAPAVSAVAMDLESYCGAIAADEDKKPDDDKKPEEGDEEPDCD